MDGNWLQTDEREDVLASLRHCLICLGLAERDKHAFKWALLSLHAALQGSCICHLATTNSGLPIGIATDRNLKEWIASNEGQRDKRPEIRIAELPVLLERIRKNNSAGDGHAGSEIALSDREFEWWRGIHSELRNQFVHFSPQGWSIELSGIPGLVDLTVGIIRQIASRGWGFRHQDEAWMSDLHQILDALATSVENREIRGQRSQFKRPGIAQP